MLLSVIFACSGSPDATPAPEAPAAPAAPSAPAAPEPPAAAPAPVSKGAPAGACPDEEGPPQSITAHDYKGGKVLEITCRFYAYQGTFEFWHIPRGVQPVRLLAGLGMPTFDAATGTITNLEKARGPGDCGDWTKHVIGEEGLKLVEHRSRGCDAAVGDGEEIPPPTEWPLVE